MRKVYLNFDRGDSAELIHEKIADALDLPEYYGGNLDALHDCLTEIDEETCVGVYGSLAGTARDRILRVFCDAEKENPRLCVFTFLAEEPLAEEEAEMMGRYLSQGEENE